MSEALLQYEVLVLVMYRALVKGYCLFHSTFAVCQGCRGWSEHGQVEASQEAAALAPSTFAELEVVHNLLIVFPCFQVPVTVICSSWGREEKLFNVKIREMHSACVLSLCWDEILQPGCHWQNPKYFGWAAEFYPCNWEVMFSGELEYYLQNLVKLLGIAFIN